MVSALCEEASHAPSQSGKIAENILSIQEPWRSKIQEHQLKRDAAAQHSSR